MQRLFKPDWKQVFEPADVKRQVCRIVGVE